ncbi:putative Chromosome-associated kinesin KLP1 [Corchorus olitorius]|uniref:Chromosome-associated kinesin KLP1 n=1 Tax=Corchorus olitorius TaxID=93759 RepID=A0A1R3GVZ7_9ROSI|nr:putative Chromosome-associated kinesin KLP1 [Corchorus olitorius]
MATKRLKEMLEAHKSSACDSLGDHQNPAFHVYGNG